MVTSFRVLFAAGYLAGEKLQGPCHMSISTPTAFHEHATVFNKADSMAEKGAEKNLIIMLLLQESHEILGREPSGRFSNTMASLCE